MADIITVNFEFIFFFFISWAFLLLWTIQGCPWLWHSYLVGYHIPSTEGNLYYKKSDVFQTETLNLAVFIKSKLNFVHRTYNHLPFINYFYLMYIHIYVYAHIYLTGMFEESWVIDLCRPSLYFWLHKTRWFLVKKKNDYYRSFLPVLSWGLAMFYGFWATSTRAQSCT